MTAAALSTPSSSPRERAFHGQRFGEYTLFEPIGRGGMAELFLARAETLLGATRLAVVKLILPAYAEDPRFAGMLVHEAKLAARLSHRHIVQVFDLGREDGREDGRLYIAMEYVEGFDLNALVRLCSERGIGLPAKHALGIVLDVLEGLDYAHRRRSDSGKALGIVHRDVSPSNVLISYEGEVKVCDFGIAHANSVVEGDDANEALRGKAGYMSPEHARGMALDARADVFAAGIILWELLAGRRLYAPKRSGVPLLEQARRAEIPPLPEHGLPDPEELQRIVSRALARDREARYPSAAAFQRELEDYLAAAKLLSSRLELGSWLSSSFGTGLIDERRASERRLPKSSAPPPRPSGLVRKGTGSESEISVPRAPRLPHDLADLATMGTLVLPEPERPIMDPPPSSSPVSPVPAAPDLDAKHREDQEMVSWARKRGVVTLFFFISIAAVIAVIWAVTR